MKYLVMVLMLAGCAGTDMQSIGEALRTAGGVSSDRVAAENEARAGRPSTTQAPRKQLDGACYYDCMTRNQGHNYCDRVCSY
jgi:hypothetical protein